MAHTISKRVVSDTYLKLIRQFPLRHIASEAELDEATQVLRDLLQQDLDEGGTQYRDALTDLIETYETIAYPIPEAPQSAVLELLIQSNGQTGTELAKKTGIAHSTISAVLHGGRKLTAEQIRKLARHFKVSAAVFFSAA